MPTSLEIQIPQYITGEPKLSDFKIVTADIPEPNDSQVLIKNIWMTVDPYMRGRMINKKSYVPPFKLNTPLEGQAIGIVENSQHPDYSKGDVVSSMKGWREYFLADTSELQKIKTDGKNLQHYLSVLGMTGLTAYGGLLTIGKPQKGETVFVSAASGAVGSLVCQIAKLKGCKVIASAGSTEKVEWLKNEIGVDVAFNYKTCGNIDEALQKSAPKGIDIYFENVGGEHLQAAINNMNAHGRIIMCGMISQYNLDKPEPGPNNLMQIIGKRLLIQGFIVSDFESLRTAFYRDMIGWMQKGQIKTKESIKEGIESAPQAFLNLFSGHNFGKMLVKI